MSYILLIHGESHMNKKVIISIIAIAVLVVLYIIIGRQMLIHRSDLKVGSERVYYHETSRFVSCDLAFIEVLVHEDENNRNGLCSCLN